MKTDGPKVRLELSCFDCKHEESVSFRCQSDSGHDVYCTEPTVGRKHISSYSWNTPDWCPLRAAAIAKAVEEISKP